MRAPAGWRPEQDRVLLWCLERWLSCGGNIRLDGPRLMFNIEQQISQK